MNLVTTIDYLCILEKCLQHCGVQHFLETIGFDRSRLNETASYLNYEEFAGIVKNAYHLSHCQHLGLLFGEQLSIGNHGFLGYAAMTSSTFGMALQTFQCFLNTRTSVLQGHVHVEADKAYIEINPLTGDELIDRFITEVAMVHFTRLRQFLINTQSPCLSIEMAYPEPFYSDYYKQTLKAPVYFNQPYTKVWIHASELEIPINFADSASYQQAKTLLQHLAEKIDVGDLPAQIKNMLAEENVLNLDMEAVASRLCLSSRTLRRHLQSYNITWQELYDEVRAEKARQLLSENKLSITEISYKLGFHDSSSFSKAFKRWFDVTPSEYRDLK